MGGQRIGALGERVGIEARQESVQDACRIIGGVSKGRQFCVLRLPRTGEGVGAG